MLIDMARAYLRHGAKGVMLMSRKVDKLQEQAALLRKETGGQAEAVGGDIRNADSCKAGIAKCIELYGRLDVLINGAAGNFLASANKLSANAFRTVMEIDTLGTFNMCSAAFHAYMGANGGVIINISATIHWNGAALQCHSASAKAGVDAMTKVLACEWGPHGIRVCGLVPGPIGGTEGLARLSDGNNANDKTKANNAINTSAATGGTKYTTMTIPCLRLGHVFDISACGLYLASEAASYITGTNIVVDGGSYLTAPNHMFKQEAFVEKWA